VVGYGAFAVSEAAGLDRRQRGQLREVARDSIHSGLLGRGPLQPDPSAYGGLLAEKRASFVTLKLDGRLRGCVGSLQASLPLIHSVADSAYKAAFEDPRFPPLLHSELEALAVHISVLSPGRRLEFGSEQDLLDQLQPGVHGLIIAGRGGQATFLPSVWEDLPQAPEFLRRLKSKAGLDPDIVPDAAWVYTSESF
jgi:AmmeMemoRadiSam system protein A